MSMKFGNWKGNLVIGWGFFFVCLREFFLPTSCMLKTEALSFSGGNFQLDLVYSAAEDFFDFSGMVFLKLSQFGVG